MNTNRERDVAKEDSRTEKLFDSIKTALLRLGFQTQTGVSILSTFELVNGYSDKIGYRMRFVQEPDFDDYKKEPELGELTQAQHIFRMLKYDRL